MKYQATLSQELVKGKVTATGVECIVQSYLKWHCGNIFDHVGA